MRGQKVRSGRKKCITHGCIPRFCILGRYPCMCRILSFLVARYPVLHDASAHLSTKGCFLYTCMRRWTSFRVFRKSRLCNWKQNAFFAHSLFPDSYPVIGAASLPGGTESREERLDFFALLAEPFLGWVDLGYRKGAFAPAQYSVGCSFTIRQTEISPFVGALRWRRRTIPQL